MAAGVVLMATGCRFDGVNSLPLPGSKVDGDSVTITVELANAQNLVGNSLVKADNVNVGTIRGVTLDGSTARLEVELSANASVPADAIATLAQTSVLGAQYLELSSPPNTDRTILLEDGDTIPLARTSQYPVVEEVLSALSLVLNGSGLQQIRTIMVELNTGMGGNEEEIRSVIGELETFIGGLDAQRDNLITAIDSMDRLGGELAEQTETIDRGIATIQPALGVLEQQRAQLTTMLTSLGNFGEAAHRALGSSRDDIVANLQSLQPTLTQLAAAGTELPDSLPVALSPPFPVTAADKGFRGDYLNLFLTVDLSVEAFTEKVIPSIPLDRIGQLALARQAVNPITAPFAAAGASPPPIRPGTAMQPPSAGPGQEGQPR
ncbi:MCE family protein [Rhodococcus sp. NPDC059968]|uniref:MCE family protein n=1 Tax=Rhodococcus sp. NPDC059968 TaxID=3347017 RepID=UPI00366C7DEB